MQNREFENKVQQKMDGLKLTPPDAVWDKVAASLPKEKKRRWVFFILFFSILLIGSLFLWNVFNKNTPGNTVQQAALKKEAGDSITTKAIVQDKKTTATISDRSVTEENTEPESGLHKNKKDIISGAIRIKIKKPAEVSLTDSKDEKLVDARQKEFITKGDTRIKIKNPGSAEDEKIALEKTVVVVNDSVAPVVSLPDSLNTTAKITPIDSLVTEKKDSVITATAVNKKTKDRRRWQYGIDLAAGFSNIRSDLFNYKGVYADVFANAVGSPGSPVIPIPNKPSQHIAIAIGLYAEKNIAAKWKFKTGLNYFYQSNTIKTGNKVDSVGSFTFTANSSIAAPRYYRSGKTNNYTNQFHLIEIPLLFQFNFLKRIPVYFEAGPTVGYLLSSNALIYNSSTASYFTSREIFNKLLLSIQMGAGIDIGKKTKLPFSMGYQFRYSIGSVIKPIFSEQHFINSLVYLKIPLKK